MWLSQPESLTQTILGARTNRQRHWQGFRLNKFGHDHRCGLSDALRATERGVDGGRSLPELFKFQPLQRRIDCRLLLHGSEVTGCQHGAYLCLMLPLKKAALR